MLRFALQENVLSDLRNKNRMGASVSKSDRTMKWNIRGHPMKDTFQHFQENRAIQVLDVYCCNV